MEDFWSFIVWPKASSYFRRIVKRALQYRVLDLQKNMVSSTKKVIY